MGPGCQTLLFEHGRGRAHQGWAGGKTTYYTGITSWSGKEGRKEGMGQTLSDVDASLCSTPVREVNPKKSALIGDIVGRGGPPILYLLAVLSNTYGHP